MDTENQTFLSQLGSLWTRMNPNERLVLVVSLVVLAVALAVWLTVSRSQGYALLYGGLEPADAARIVTELENRNIKYEAKDNGQTITVPPDKVDELRIALASDGFSPSGPTGYELFDKPVLGMSDFLQRQNRNRAVEGELARTLMSLDEVSAARVHLTLPEPTPFIAEQTEPMASVVLILKPGVAMSNARVAAVRTFVAGAIGSLDADKVTIIDQNMNLLTGPSSSQPGGLLPTQEEARRNYETQRAADIRSLLERAYGVGNVAVSFTCTMNFDQVESESLQYDPVSGTNTGVLRSSESTEQSMSGEGATSPVGVPGTESNTPSYPGASTQPYESESSTETKNYEVSQTHETRVEAPGKVESCSVSVLIDSTGRSEVPSSESTEVESLVVAAAGLDTTAGDTLTVSFMPFDTSLKDELEAQRAAFASKEMWDLVIKVGIILFVLMIFWTVLKNFLKPVELAFAGPRYLPEDEEKEVELPSADPEVLEKLRIREEIEKLIKEDPSSAAKVIKTWLRE
jgi:flagellar M-ring protein FliF